MSIMICLFFFLSFFEVLFCAESNYDVIIVGGGFSGLYTAMRLGQYSEGSLKIAIVEKYKATSNYFDTGLSLNGLPSNDACLGGRIKDFPYYCNATSNNNCTNKNGIIWIGEHAMRYKTVQGSYFLANELDIQHDDNNYNTSFGESEGYIGQHRGHYFYGGFISGGTELLKAKYQDEYNRGDLISNNMLDLYESMFEDEHVENLCDDNEDNDYHHIRQYASETTGSSQGLDAMKGALQFKGTWSNNDPLGMLEYFDTDEKSDEGFTVYPVGGWSEFIRKMYQVIIDNDYADIYCGFQVSNIYYSNNNKNKKNKNSDDCKYNYVVEHTNGTNKKLKAEKVILTAPVHELKYINGDIVEDIISYPEANVWNGIDTLTCSQQYDYPWYDNLFPVDFNKSSINVSTDRVDVWYSTENCMQLMENFNSNYLRGGNVLRSLYVDESECFNYWYSFLDSTDWDYDLLEKEINRRQKEYFGIDNIPLPIKTHCHISHWGWYYLGTQTNQKLDNEKNPHKRIEEWALHPLGDDEQGEHIYMCGDTWNARHDWADGARTTCDLLLNQYFDVGEDILKQWEFSLHTRSLCSAVCNSDQIIDEHCQEFPEEAILKSEF